MMMMMMMMMMIVMMLLKIIPAGLLKFFLWKVINKVGGINKMMMMTALR